MTRKSAKQYFIPVLSVFIGSIIIASLFAKAVSGFSWYPVTPPVTPPITITPTITPQPSPTPSLSVSTNNVQLTLVKDYQDPTGATLKDAFEITASKTTAWQLKNNQDATYTPENDTPTPIIGQGFGFYEASGGILAGQTVKVRAYVINSKPTGIYQGTYTLQQVDQNKTIDVATIKYRLEVEEPAPTPTITPIIIPVKNYPPVIYPKGNKLRNGIQYKYYWAKISARDINHDPVKIMILGLPKGLTSRCRSKSGKAKCVIFGRVKKAGNYKIYVLAQDNKGAATIKVYKLTIRRLNKKLSYSKRLRTYLRFLFRKS
jgi:hypothetical protein